MRLRWSDNVSLAVQLAAFFSDLLALFFQLVIRCNSGVISVCQHVYLNKLSHHVSEGPQ